MKAKLLGNYKRTGQRVNLVFLWTEFSCGPFKFKKVSPMNMTDSYSERPVRPGCNLTIARETQHFVLAAVSPELAENQSRSGKRMA